MLSIVHYFHVIVEILRVTWDKLDPIADRFVTRVSRDGDIARDVNGITEYLFG